MKLFHLADLHLGKRLNEYSLLPDQRHILQQITELVDQHEPQAVLIAGDVYDKGTPPAEAVALFDGFLSRLEARGIRVFLIPGNHDSAARLSFGREILEKRGIYIAGPFAGPPSPIKSDDAVFWLLPFLRPGDVRYRADAAPPDSYDEAVRSVLAEMRPDPAEQNILLTHQFITGSGSTPLLSESEVRPVGGLDNVDASAFRDFDYVACGHLHIPQSVGRDSLRYCGSPLKYSFSEAGRPKSVTVAELEGKGRLRVTALPLTPLRDMRVIKGPFREILEAGEPSEDYIKVLLTDFDRVPDPMAALRKLYPNLLSLSFERRETEGAEGIASAPEGRDPLELFSEFYQKQTGLSLTKAQQKMVKEELSHAAP